MDKQETIALLTGAVEDARKLVTLETRLLKLEALIWARKARATAALCAVASLLVGAALVLAGLGAASGLHETSGNPAWVCQLLVAAGGLLAAFLCVAAGAWLWKTNSKESIDGTGTREIAAGNRSHYPVPTR